MLTETRLSWGLDPAPADTVPPDPEPTPDPDPAPPPPQPPQPFPPEPPEPDPFPSPPLEPPAPPQLGVAFVPASRRAPITGARRKGKQARPMAQTALHDDELWAEFHRVVNMSSRELADWLRTRSATLDAEPLPDQAGTPTGRQVLHILSKRRTDLNPEDLLVMHRVVRQVHAQRRGDREAVAGRASWRHRLMSLGHDPLKPA